jgi:hypothetical protein
LEVLENARVRKRQAENDPFATSSDTPIAAMVPVKR